MLDRAISVLDATRTNLKLEPGTYSAAASITSNLALSVYGPATVPGFYFSNGSLRLRDMVLTDLLACGATSLVPHARLDAARIQVTESIGQGSDVVSLSRCDTHIVDSTLTEMEAAFVIRVKGNGGADGSSLRLERSYLKGGGGSLRVDDFSSVDVSNCVFDSPTNAVSYMSSVASSTIAFSTFYNTVWTCQTGNVVFASKNNIFLNEKSGAPTDTVSGTQCQHSYDLVKPQSTTPPGSNNIVNQDPRFANAASGGFHLIAGSPAIDAADPTATAAVDFDGTARPQGAGRDIGAFEYKP